MTAYAGEEYRVKATPRDFDNGPVLGPSAITGMHVSIYDPQGDEVISEEQMTWSADGSFWYYLWDTAGLTHGTYKAKCVVVSLTFRLSWEWKKIRLAKDPVPAG